MTEEIANVGRTLNATFLPASLLRKNENKLATSLTAKYQFQKTTGNSFITIDPPEIKFAGYQLDKSYTATVRIINRAPIPQRVVIIAPESPAFSIKSNKKGSIASGMAENITVVFRSNEYKYQTDVVSIRTETENFVVPLYAFPTLPDLRAIFPKVIDFGAVECRQPATFQYPINNTVPLNFEFQFTYLKQSQQISINPLKGVIPAHETLVVEITFVPTTKSTSTAEVLLHIHQFDSQPLPIKIIGSGTQAIARPVPKRIKSSKLAPLKEGEESRDGNKTAQSRLKRRPSGQIQQSLMGQNNQLSATGTINPGQLGVATLKKTNIRTTYPKLMSVRKTVVQEQDTKALNPAQIAEREYLNKFSRIHDLDKEKQIKFSQFLGDKAMTQLEIQFQQQLVAEIQKARLQALEKSCRQRINPQLSSQVAVEFKIVPQKTVTWDDKKNDEHHNRRKALVRFMNAGTKVILQYRLIKRLGKIRQLLSGCRGKDEVRKLVEESHIKAMDRQKGFQIPQDCELSFGLDSLCPSYFQLQFQQNKQKQGSIIFQPLGRTSFDDLTEIKQIIPHNIDKLKLAELPFPADYYNHQLYIPPPRQSAEQQYFYKTSALPEIVTAKPTLAYALPIKVPAHHFIYDDQKIKRYQNYIVNDEKDPEVYLKAEEKIEDQFEGWTGGDYQILKYKFTRNLGCQYTSFSGFNASSDRYPLPPLASLGQGLPTVIDQPSYQDTIQQGDSDEEDINEAPVEAALKFLDQIEGKNADLKQRRSKKQLRNPEKGVHEIIEKNLSDLKLKTVGEYVGKVKQANKWVETASNRLLL